MLGLQNLKHGLLLHTTAVATNATSGTYIDTLEGDELHVLVHLGTGTNTTPPSVLQFEQSDTTDASNFSAITGYTGGTNDAGGFTIANQNTSAATLVSYTATFARGIRWTKRYVRLQIRMAGATANVTSIGLLGRNAISPITAAECGVTLMVTPS